jgi:murein L,D-transpeptidase YafK
LRVRIHKSRGLLELFRGDERLRTIPVITGKNPSDKRCEGDLATPEGEFYICSKNPRSRYVCFLGLSYPNLEDAVRGLRDGLITRRQVALIRAAIARRGRPPWETPLGGEIGLHGPGPHETWTHGCISMAKEEIMELGELLPLGAEVEVFR